MSTCYRCASALLACEYKGWVGQVNVAILIQFSYLLLCEACMCAKINSCG